MALREMDPNNIKIKIFEIEEYDQLISLWETSGLPFKPQGRDSKEKITNEIKLGNAIFLIAELDGDIVGSIFGTHDGRKGWINRL